MTFSLIYPDSYNKRAKKFLRRHPDLVNQYRKTLELLELNPYHPSLRLHCLNGQHSGLSSVSINRQYRIMLEMIIKEDEIILVSVGSHDQVY